MTVTAFTFVGMYDHALDTAANILTKGADHAKANGVAESEMLGWRLIEDMAPLSFQLMVVCNFTRQWTARFVGLPVPDSVTEDLDVAGYRRAISDSKAWLAALTPEQFEGRDELPLAHLLGTGFEPTLPLGRWLTVFATTNIYFHLSTAYGILRARGVPLGKPDMFAAGL